MNCNTDRERGVNPGCLYCTNPGKRFFKQFMKLQNLKKPQQKPFHIDKQAGLSNYECSVTRKIKYRMSSVNSFVLNLIVYNQLGFF